MRVFRFMSQEEIRRFLKGEELINNTKHKGRTMSVGFCFLDTNDFKPEEALHFLSGIVTPDVCAVFETDKRNLTESMGMYADHSKDDHLSIIELIDMIRTGKTAMFKAKEYCTTKYSLKKFTLIKACAVPDLFSKEYSEHNEFEWIPYRYPNKNFYNLFKGEKNEQTREKKIREEQHKADGDERVQETSL